MKDFGWAVGPDGRDCSAADAERLSRDCTCYGCGRPVLACNREFTGRKIPPYFRHLPEDRETKCDGGGETREHHLAKQILRDAGQVWIPEVSASVRDPLLGVCTYVSQEARMIQCDIIHENHPDYRSVFAKFNEQFGFIPDAVGILDGTFLIIEIWNTSRKQGEAIRRISQAGYRTLEIDVREMANLAPEDVPRFVTQTAPRTWVYNADVDHARDHLEKCVAATKERRAEAAERKRAKLEMYAQEDAAAALAAFVTGDGAVFAQKAGLYLRMLETEAHYLKIKMAMCAAETLKRAMAKCEDLTEFSRWPANEECKFKATAEFNAACDARTAALTGVFEAEDVLADREAIRMVDG